MKTIDWLIIFERLDFKLSLGTDRRVTLVPPLPSLSFRITRGYINYSGFQIAS